MELPRPTPEELKLAIMVTRPGALIGSGVACVLLGELQALRRDFEELAIACENNERDLSRGYEAEQARGQADGETARAIRQILKGGA